ncbi:hypothetical protein DFH11DRAFT_1721846 [Phellopilus nigrolimitatus]|nr:hypothetical protein DFH11DRAFT_1721846 [Phellopilus nigrolimitatus]
MPVTVIQRETAQQTAVDRTRLKFIDIGVNLTDPVFRGMHHGRKKHEDDFDLMLERAKAAGVRSMIITGGSLKESQKALQIAQKYGLYATVGCHPTRSAEFASFEIGPEGYLSALDKTIAENLKGKGRVVAVGECGLDYDRLHFASKEVQKQYFKVQLSLAKKYHLPLFLHSRAAHTDFVRILREEGFGNDGGRSVGGMGGVVHSFTGKKEELQELVAMGFHISVNGCSMKTEDNLEVAKAIPSGKLMLETGAYAPWCSMTSTHASERHLNILPAALREVYFPSAVKPERHVMGKMVKGRNEPCSVGGVAWVMSRLHEGVSVERVAEHAWRNTVDLFMLGELEVKIGAFKSANSNPYGAGDPYYNQSSGFLPPQAPKKRISNWIKFGVPILILVIIGAVVGGVVGSKKSSSDAASSSKDPSAIASSAANAKTSVGRFAVSTNSDYMMPVYPATTNTAVFTSPTFIDTTNSNLAWPSDSFKPSNPSPTQVRSDRPRLIAPAYKWAALPNLIAHDPYLAGWNQTIFGNASAYKALPPVVYFMDGDSGILDNAREVKERVKAFSYVYRMTNDTSWVDRCWMELQNAAGNGSAPFGPAVDRWNSVHFLDTGEMSAAFAIAYDWLYDVWTADQKEQIRFTLLEYGLNLGLAALTQGTNGWWSNVGTTGNWNCVCNNGLTMGALAILGDDTTGVAQQLLGLTIPNALENCAWAVSDDGSWAETANYWYFGTTGYAEMTSSLMTATGSDQGMLHNNPNFNLTGLFHLYIQGATSLFNYGDHGPNKYSTTANGMMFMSENFDIPLYTLYQREQYDAAEPWAMFWYDPTVSGAFWDGLALDHFFDNHTDQWASMRSSFTDNNALYVAAKAGMLQGHQTHNDLDCGDFVIDALGTRWAGELGSGDYLSTGYFSSDDQDSQRWLYYRKRTEGQNTIMVGQANQNVSARPTVKSGSSGTQQGSSTVFDVPDGSTAYWIADLTTAYFNVTSFSRGVRLINNRKQVLIQDEITASQAIQWRMHTNASVSISGTTATLTIGNETLIMQLPNAPNGATLGTAKAVRLSTDPALPPGQTDQDNPGVTVITIDLPAGSYTLEVLFNPQWPGMSSGDFQTPSQVALSDWTLTSHG